LNQGACRRLPYPVATENRFVPSALNLEKAVSRKARKEHKGKSVGYLILAFHLIGAGLYLHKYLNFFAALAPLRE
jgi:hypothetical protein